MNPAIGRWIINLAIISILGVAVDILLPSGSMKKYVRFLIGITILTAMLQPILKAFDQLPNLEKYTAQAFATMDFADLGYQVRWLEGRQKREIMDYFVETIESHMEQQIKQIKGYDRVKVNVEMDENFNDGSQVPDILKVYVDVGAPADSHIKPVRIDVETKDIDALQSDKPSRASKDQQEIKAILSSIYGIDQSRIEVSIKDSLHNGQGDNEQ